ncbi:hypothetical protein B0H16DRAFT_286533 [Mycena metata]|uniref:Uncharacterized protein n=1 Tax=Mycena metata TaxID=1033252 RepID=A0AAD7HPE7_9AGAR|nr:hypothetical protein B0H16DRAFT_286533 [Mycena metata]
MPRLKVLFTPRPFSASVGSTEWMPRGLLYGPFHPEHEEIPPDASQEYIFECSDALHSCLREFYRTICPLLTPIPSLENTNMLCAIYAEHISSSRIDALRVLLAFETRLKREVLQSKRCLPGKDPEADKQVALGGFNGGQTRTSENSRMRICFR